MVSHAHLLKYSSLGQCNADSLGEGLLYVRSHCVCTGDADCGTYCFSMSGADMREALLHPTLVALEAGLPERIARCKFLLGVLMILRVCPSPFPCHTAMLLLQSLGSPVCVSSRCASAPIRLHVLQRNVQRLGGGGGGFGVFGLFLSVYFFFDLLRKAPRVVFGP